MRRLIIALLILFVSIPLAAQTRKCENTDKISECTNSIVKSTLLARADDEKPATAAKEEKDVTTETTGVPTIDSFLGNSTRDFLSLFAAALQSANLSEEKDALTLDWNLRIKNFNNDPIKLQGVLRKATLWKDFTDHLPTGTDRAKLEDQLGDFDDITLSVTYEPEGKKYGRNLEPHSTLFDRIHGGTADVISTATAEFAFGKFVQDNPKLFEQNQDPRFIDIPDAQREQVRQLVITAAEEIVKNRAAFDQKFAPLVDRFSELLNNQPQIYFSASRRDRASLVGPRETSIKATYEMGFVNINAFLRGKTAKDACDDEKGDNQLCSAEFEKYVTDSGNKADLNAANRISFSFEYADVEGYKITNDLVPTPFDVKGSRVTNGSFTYGRIMRRDRENHRDGRIDLSVTYADVRGDPEKDNLFTASAVYTQKMSDTVSFPIGIVWSNRDKHVPDSDHRLSAHFGLMFKLPK